MRRVLVMSSRGFASRTMKSALRPASTTPRSLSPMNSAELRVAATMASPADIPAATMSSNSTWTAHGTLPSVPKAIRAPWAWRRARFRAWIPKDSRASGRSSVI